MAGAPSASVAVMMARAVPATSPRTSVQRPASRAAAGSPAPRAALTNTCAGTALAIITATLALGAPAVFTDDPAVRHVAVGALLASALTQPLAALAFVLDGLILGIADYTAMRRAMILAIFAFAPMAALVLRFPWLGLPGVWAALGCWLAARSVLLGKRWREATRRYSSEEDLYPERTRGACAS